MGKIGKNYIYSLMYQILVLIAPIVTAPYLARVIGADNLGIYSYISSAASIITTISLLGIYSYGNRQTAYVRDSRTTLTSTFWELEVLRVILGVIGTVVYFAYAALTKKYIYFFLMFYPYVLAQFIDCSWVYVGMENMKPAVLKNAVTKIINVLGIFLFIKSKEDLWIYICLLSVTTLLANVSIYTQLPQYIDRPVINTKALLGHLKGSISLFLPQVASLLYLQVDKVMMEWLTGETNQIAYYDQAEKIVTIPLTLITVISSVVMPRLANEHQKGDNKAIQGVMFKAAKYALCLAMPLMLGLFCISRQLIGWYLGAEFSNTAIAMMILTPIVLLNTLAGISGNQYFTATNQMRILLRAYVTAAIINIIINAILIPHFGYVGAAVATVVSSLASVVTQYYTFSKQVTLKEIWRCMMKYLIGAVIMASVLIVFTWNMNSSALTTLIQAVAGAGIYGIYLVVTKDTVIQEMVNIMKRKR